MSESQTHGELYNALLVNCSVNLAEVRIIRVSVGHAENMPVERIQELSFQLKRCALIYREVS